MTEPFTIETFITNRWIEAKKELEVIAPKFVQSLQAYDALMQHGFVLPEGLPEPEKRLAFNWYEVLESTVDIAQALERLDLSLKFLEGNVELRLARFFYEVWVQSAYGLCEKIESLIAHTCKLHSLNQKERKKYYGLLNANVRQEIDKSRTAIVHGANRPGKNRRAIAATGITEDGLWEGLVFNGPGIIKAGLEQTHQSGHLSAQDYFTLLRQTNVNVLARLGEILEKLDQKLREDRGRE